MGFLDKMNNNKKTPRPKGSSLPQLVQIIIFAIVQILMLCFWDMKVMILIIVPIVSHVWIGQTRILFRKPQKEERPSKTYIPEKIWQIIVLAILVVEGIIAAIETLITRQPGFFIELVLYPIVILIAYAILTGQTHLKYKKGERPKRSNWKEGKEYVVSANLYRDKYGNYYDLNGIPTLPPNKH